MEACGGPCLISLFESPEPLSLHLEPGCPTSLGDQVSLFNHEVCLCVASQHSQAKPQPKRREAAAGADQAQASGQQSSGLFLRSVAKNLRGEYRQVYSGIP